MSIHNAVQMYAYTLSYMCNLSGASTNGRGLEGKEFYVYVLRKQPPEFDASSDCPSHLAGKSASVSLASLPEAMDKRHQLQLKKKPPTSFIIFHHLSIFLAGEVLNYANAIG